METDSEITISPKKLDVPDKNSFNHLLDTQPANGSKDIHPVDRITKVIEGEGIKLLLSMLHKAELLALCEHCGIVVETTTHKRDIINVIGLVWLDCGTRKFLKKKVSDSTLAIFCRNLKISGSVNMWPIELIIKHINVLGLEHYAQRLQDENFKAIAELTREGKFTESKKKVSSSGSQKTSPIPELTRSPEVLKPKPKARNLEKSPRRINIAKQKIS